MKLFSHGRQGCPTTIIQAFQDGAFTDLKITCGPKTFKVHQLVVCTACELFKKILISSDEDFEGKHIHLPGEDPEMIRRLISYLYLGDYDPCSGLAIRLSSKWREGNMTQLHTQPASVERHPRNNSILKWRDDCACLVPPSRDASSAEANKNWDTSGLDSELHSTQIANPLTVHATMYSIAQKYEVAGLATLARDKFQSCISSHVFSKDFVTAVSIAYSSTPENDRRLRDVVVKAFWTCFGIKLSDVPGAEAKLNAIDELSLELIKTWPKKYDQQYGTSERMRVEATLQSSYLSFRPSTPPSVHKKEPSTPRKNEGLHTPIKASPSTPKVTVTGSKSPSSPFSSSASLFGDVDTFRLAASNIRESASSQALCALANDVEKTLSISSASSTKSDSSVVKSTPSTPDVSIQVVSTC